jgi:hypothetical protein
MPPPCRHHWRHAFTSRRRPHAATSLVPRLRLVPPSLAPCRTATSLMSRLGLTPPPPRRHLAHAVPRRRPHAATSLAPAQVLHLARASLPTFGSPIELPHFCSTMEDKPIMGRRLDFGAPVGEVCVMYSVILNPILGYEESVKDTLRGEFRCLFLSLNEKPPSYS